MPEHVSKTGLKHWYITSYGGPWQVCSSSRPTAQYPRGFWYVLNTKTDATHVVGPVSLKGKNWYDEARLKAEELNAKWLDEHTLHPLERMMDWSMRKINRVFRNCDESSKWPVRGRFNATNRAIARLAAQRRNGNYMVTEGYEYAMALDREISLIVNDPSLQ